MSVLKYFKNTPGRPTGPKCNFFSSNLQRGPWKKKGPVAPPTGDRGACRPPSGDHWAPPTGAAGGPVAPPGNRGNPLI